MIIIHKSIHGKYNIFLIFLPAISAYLKNKSLFLFWWSHQPNQKIQITKFSILSNQNVLYNSVAINISNPELQMNYTAHFGDLKQKNYDRKLVLWLVTSPTKLVTRMDGAPRL